MDHYADDLATVIDTLHLENVTAVGFSTGGGKLLGISVGMVARV